ncbi:MAG: hypothetical protein ACOVOX_17850, partial [Burkholderiaceae bacterium]
MKGVSQCTASKTPSHHLPLVRFEHLRKNMLKNKPLPLGSCTACGTALPYAAEVCNACGADVTAKDMSLANKHQYRRGAESNNPVASFITNFFRSIVSSLLFLAALVFAVYGPRLLPGASILWFVAAFGLFAVSVLVSMKRTRATLILGLVALIVPAGLMWGVLY